MIIQPKLFSPTGSKQRKHFFKTYEKFSKASNVCPLITLQVVRSLHPLLGTNSRCHDHSLLCNHGATCHPVLFLCLFFSSIISLSLLLFNYLFFQVSSAVLLAFFLCFFCSSIISLSLSVLLFYYLSFFFLSFLVAFPFILYHISYFHWECCIRNTCNWHF